MRPWYTRKISVERSGRRSEALFPVELLRAWLVYDCGNGQKDTAERC